MEEKITIADQLVIALTSTKNYKKLTKIKTGKTVAYMVLFVFLLVFIEFGINTIGFLADIGGFKNMFTTRVPAFQVENSELTMEDELELAVADTIIYVNTDYENITMDDIHTDGVYMAFGRKNIVMGMVNGSQNYTYFQYILGDIFPDGFNNEKLCDMIPAFYVGLVIVYLCLMIGKAVQMVFLALIFSILGRALANNFMTNLSYENVFRICLYGQSLSMLVTSINLCLGYLIPSGILMVITLFVSCGYISRGIISHSRFSGMPPQS